MKELQLEPRLEPTKFLLYSVAQEAASVSQLRLSLFSSSLCLVEVFGCVVTRFDRYANAFLVSECHLKLSELR